MCKGILVTTENEFRVMEFERPLYQSIGKVVDGYIEIVRPVYMPRPLVLIINDEGRLRDDFQANIFGSFVYGFMDHGEPIVGPLVIMEDGIYDGQHDIVGIHEEAIEGICEILRKFGLVEADGEEKVSDPETAVNTAGC